MAARNHADKWVYPTGDFICCNLYLFNAEMESWTFKSVANLTAVHDLKCCGYPPAVQTFKNTQIYAPFMYISGFLTVFLV